MKNEKTKQKIIILKNKIENEKEKNYITKMKLKN